MINLGPTLQLKPYCELVLSFVLKQHYTFTLIKKKLIFFKQRKHTKNVFRFHKKFRIRLFSLNKQYNCFRFHKNFITRLFYLKTKKNCFLKIVFRFHKKLASVDSYDVVVDGLNVALSRWPGVNRKSLDQQSISVS